MKTSAHLDREEISIFNLVAHAQDSGMPEWECTSQVIIEINDINDNAPVFDQKGIFLCWQKILYALAIFHIFHLQKSKI